MNFEEILPYLNNISKIVRGKEIIYGEHKSFSSEIDEMVKTIGFIDFLRKERAEVKAEVLASCSNQNFINICNTLGKEEIFEVIKYSSLYQLREILKKSIAINSEIDVLYSDLLIDNISSFEEDRRTLIKGYINKYFDNKTLIDELNSKEENKNNFDREQILLELKELTDEYKGFRAAHDKVVENLKNQIKELTEKIKRLFKIA